MSNDNLILQPTVNGIISNNKYTELQAGVEKIRNFLYMVSLV
jgi:hypothetical protein